jgi:hypothetical protein
MPRILFVVDDAFLIKGRGLVPLPGIVPMEGERFRVGDPILLKRPDGTSKRWRIGGIEMFTTPAPRYDFPILLDGLVKEDAPVGTEVWSVDGDEDCLDRDA